MGKIFGTDGIRLKVKNELQAEFLVKISQAICEEFGERSVFLLGRDVRYGGELIRHAIISGFLTSGCRVYDAGLITTPALQYVIKNEGFFDGGVMITASHNPPEYNGIKVIDSDGIEIPREKENEIEKIYLENRISGKISSEEKFFIPKYPDPLDKYLEGILDNVDDEIIKRRNFKVVVDGANSVGSLVIPKLVKLLGGKPISLNSHLDPDFSGRLPEPTPETLFDTSNVVKAVNADLGIAVDGDADRSIFLDEFGNVLWGDKTAVILSIYLSEKNPELPKKVYTGISSSYFIEELLKKRGIDVIWMKVGSVDIARKLKKEGGLLGFEENGGIMYPKHQYVRDAGMALALMLEVMSAERKKISELYSIYPKTYTIKTKYSVDISKAKEIIEKIKNCYRSYPMIDIDGVKVLQEDSWFLVRPSGTEPVLRVMVESKIQNKEKLILKELEKIILG